MCSGFRNTGVSEDEGQHLQSVYLPAKAFGGPGRFGFNAGARLTETSELVTEENCVKLFSEWSRFWDLKKNVLVEKSPPNIIRTRFLQELFPNSYFLIIMRHPIVVSYATRKWCNASLESLIEHWLICHRLLMKDLLHVRRYLIIKYEDFVAATQQSLDEIYAFLNVKSHHNLVEVDKGLDEKYLNKWREYRNLLMEKSLFHGYMQKYESQVNQFGYSLHLP